MNIHEYQAKAVLKEFGVAVSRGVPILKAAGINARVVDTRWLSPLPKEALTAAVQGAKRILIVDETRHSGGVAEALMAHFHEAAPGVPLARLTAEDSFIATGPAYAVTMPSSSGIVAAAKELVK